MTSQKLEYDAAIGGTVTLAGQVPTYRYAADAIKEMRELVGSIRNPTSTKLIFQTLPKHMRRRAMSHHPKRLPRKYRTAHRAQMAKAGKPNQTKRPSRKHRRRPRNLLREYLRRQRRHVWLETHIWHARRFHMIDKWGYRLPYASCDKTYRACYRATAEHCLLQDISFHACLQIEGPLDLLREGFERLSSAKCGLSIAAKRYISGQREGTIDLFKDGQYPNCALGRVTFLWRPLDEQLLENADANEQQHQQQQRVLWMWVHPSGYQVILEEIIKVFNLISMKNIKVQLPPEENSNTSPKKLPVKTERRLQFMTKTFAYERIKRYANEEKSIKLSELKDTMNRFRLTGPLSQSVLSHAFKVTSNCDSITAKWFREHLANDESFRTHHEAQAKYWQQCSELSSPTDLLSNMVIALNIDDPRIHRPQKRSKAALIDKYASSRINIKELWRSAGPSLAQCTIWNDELRHHICEQMISTHEYCELRRKHAVVPGEKCAFEVALQPVPIILIQRPGSQDPQYKRLGYGCGWDVIAPAGYGMAIWMSLIMWGARPGGLREFDSIARESGSEQHLPDTAGGLQTSAQRHEELRSKYFRLPPNKRCNYRKFAIVSPFRAPFTQLVRDWLTSSMTPNDVQTATVASSQFHVLRDRALLLSLKDCVQMRKHNPFPTTIPNNCIIQIQFYMQSRGNPGDFSLICLPTNVDFKRQLKQIKKANRDPIYTEPLLKDPYEKERKQLRTEHKKLLKRLRARRVREKRKKQETATQRIHIRPAGTSHLVAEQFKKMCALWLPEDVSTLFSVRKQCTRDTIGYVSTVNFSYIEARVCGIGYITRNGLLELIDICRKLNVRQPMLLIRDTNSRHYRFATFKFNLEV